MCILADGTGHELEFFVSTTSLRIMQIPRIIRQQQNGGVLKARNTSLDIKGVQK
jgi:hypothetical protein